MHWKRECLPVSLVLLKGVSDIENQKGFFGEIEKHRFDLTKREGMKEGGDEVVMQRSNEDEMNETKSDFAKKNDFEGGSRGRL